jgi:hypothetical protein
VICSWSGSGIAPAAAAWNSGASTVMVRAVASSFPVAKSSNSAQPPPPGIESTLTAPKRMRSRSCSERKTTGTWLPATDTLSFIGFLL